VERPRGARAAGRGDPAGAGLLAPSAAGPAAGFAALVGLTFCLIVLGALVRANDAGLACPDWPLCFGELVPRMNLRVGFEWSHRLVAGSISLGFVALAVLTLRSPETRARCAGLLAVAAALLATQVILGALTVWHLLASWTVTAHLITGNLFCATLLWTTLALHEVAEGSVQVVWPGPVVRGTVATAALLLAVQMVLGGLVASRYAGLACPEWPACNGGVWFPSFAGPVGLHVLHRLNGYALLVALLAAAALAARGSRPLRRATALAAGLALLQVAVGVTNVLLGLPVEVTGLHSALAAGLVLTMSIAVREVLRPDPLAVLHTST
jgi:cytochrome c oxidase assembly protein subunit 15